MGADQIFDWAKASASTLEWWEAAGVDVLVSDDPFDWLAAPEAETPARAADSRAPDRADQAAPPAAPARRALALPPTLEGFLAWRIGADAPEAGWGGALIGASGAASADLMILADCPDRDDRDELFSGETARLFDRMLAAIGRTRADVHLAAVAAARPIAGRLPREQQDALFEIARHHVALVAPKRLLTLGNAASRALLSMDVAEARGRLHPVDHKGGRKTEVVASYHPRLLRERPAAKAEAWRDLQLLIGGIEA
ncbi:uracil-DNA glycosylase family protein [uncultured Sphingomonas sp.]|uniref:uracil-DNA glycosylase family protein n=1 Tax=uncultured Sphingomonas sp. TaxID=158754 RepID=UPI002602CC49|nr:uracil-DNA glycosylase family protein [uncultured Sphingomonas sp.]